jgi:hypothetical protein
LEPWRRWRIGLPAAVSPDNVLYGTSRSC